MCASTQWRRLLCYIQCYAELESKEAYGRAAEAWEVANVMMFLASDYSSYMTGEIVPVSSQRG